MGCKSVLQVFCKRSNFKGTICFSTGVFFVASGLPVLGMMLETLGIFLLLSDFRPVLAQNIAELGWGIQQPYIRSFLDKYRSNRLPV
ncbi:unnamed protein product [Arabidopsis halleri]